MSPIRLCIILFLCLASFQVTLAKSRRLGKNIQHPGDVDGVMNDAQGWFQGDRTRFLTPAARKKHFEYQEQLRKQRG